MSIAALLLLALALGSDAFAAALGKGVAHDHPRLADAARTAAYFGIAEAAMVALGYGAGSAARGVIESVDHWIAFVLLSVIGGRMILAALKPAAEGEARPTGRVGPTVMVLTALGTSIDSAIVGVTLALVAVNPWLAVPVIGLASFSMSLTGVLLGRRLGSVLGKWAEIAGGLVLIAIGTKILVDHLSQGG